MFTMMICVVGHARMTLDVPVAFFFQPGQLSAVAIGDEPIRIRNLITGPK